MMISFNPGPSQLSPVIVQALQDIASSGLLSLSHRSEAFKNICEESVLLLKKNMGIPSDYHVVFQSSATVCMDTILRNLVSRKSFHFVHGAFSQRFLTTAKELKLEAEALESPWEDPVPWESAHIANDTELVSITHNETSSGLMWPQSALSAFRSKHPDPLLAVDVTSSFGSLSMNWADADLWFASVQKCLGLPAGLAILLIGPRALEEAKAKQRNAQTQGIAAWQRFDSLCEKMALYQTVETPNVLGIALLARQMRQWDLKTIEVETLKKASLIIEQKELWTPFIHAEAWRSPTLLNLTSSHLKLLHQQAKEQGFLLGKGYGKLKGSCLRLANFPAITEKALRDLFQALSK